ncbi:hypothetical protein ACXHPV_12685, partial [Vibrio cincinnatiensis]
YRALSSINGKSFIASSLVNRIAMIDSLVSLKLVVIRKNKTDQSLISYCFSLRPIWLESLFLFINTELSDCSPKMIPSHL